MHRFFYKYFTFFKQIAKLPCYSQLQLGDEYYWKYSVHWDMTLFGQRPVWLLDSNRRKYLSSGAPMGACFMYMFHVHSYCTKSKNVKYQNWDSRKNTPSLGTVKVYQMMIFKIQIQVYVLYVVHFDIFLYFRMAKKPWHIAKTFW